MKKATYTDAALVAYTMNMKIDDVWTIIGGMKFSSYSELVMAVMLCLRPLHLESFTSTAK